MPFTLILKHGNVDSHTYFKSKRCHNPAMNGPHGRKNLGCSCVIIEGEAGGKTNARKPSPQESEKYKKL